MQEKLFDSSYFNDPVTGKFRFSAYTTNWKGVLQARDLTPYKKECFRGLPEDEISNFDLKRFESAKLPPLFAVESLMNLPAGFRRLVLIKEFANRNCSSCF